MSENKQQRIRCSDELFLEAVFSSETYSEISEKTGQKLASTMARYTRVKEALLKRGIDLPIMKRVKTEKKTDSVQNMVEIVKRLKEYNSQ